MGSGRASRRAGRVSTWANARQLLAALPSLSWADGSHLEKATAEIVRYQFFELCNEGRYVEVIRAITIRACRGVLTVHRQSNACVEGRRTSMHCPDLSCSATPSG